MDLYVRECESHVGHQNINNSLVGGAKGAGARCNRVIILFRSSVCHVSNQDGNTLKRDAQ